MKILIGMPSKDSWGGPISSEPPFVEALRKKDLAVREEIYVYGDREKPTPLSERIKRVLKTAFRFRTLLKNNDFDIVHLNSAFDLKTILRDSFSLFVMNPKKTKVFFKFHGSEAQEFFEANFFIRFLINFIARKADGFGIHTTDELANFVRLGFEKDKFYFVKNTVPIPEKLTVNFSRKHKDKDDLFELIFVSRFVPNKCLPETITACQIVKEKGYNFKLFCIGDGETRLEAEKLVQKLKLENDVEFTGYIPEEEVSEFFFKSDILVFPTKFGEGFPNVFFKALTAGMPIVATRFRAAKDFLDAGKHYLACTSEPENIAEKIIELIENKELRVSISENNLKFGKTLLPESIAEDFLEIYRKAVTMNS
jgi:glycosyltransferase involved in cell wall biosynthesis